MQAASMMESMLTSSIFVGIRASKSFECVFDSVHKGCVVRAERMGDLDVVGVGDLQDPDEQRALLVVDVYVLPDLHPHMVALQGVLEPKRYWLGDFPQVPGVLLDQLGPLDLPTAHGSQPRLLLLQEGYVADVRVTPGDLGEKVTA